MLLREVKIGNLKTGNNVFLAPLAGYTNGVFRTVCEKLGAGLTFTEMVSAKGLCYGSEKTEQLLYVSEDYRGIKAAQIFGNDPEYMRRACESDALAKFDLIDINMGCPVPKIYKNGEGSALMNDLPLVGRIVSECKKSGKLVSVKFRTGLDESRKITAEFARVCAGAGADLICIHGRTRDKTYSGAVDFEEIAAAKRAVDIPVIANGGIFCAADADELLEKTGADGVAVARGAMYRPWVFAEITGKEIPDIKDIVRGQLHKTREIYGERFACVFMRKMIGFYLKGTPDAAACREKLFKADSCEKVEEILETLNFV
ncbi:MAG: tRNA-dihydrouridine synthase family protein [Clostridia bacterium]|nr:tRNA-dihydrouridine synthase family protein [Clostridia bacterium]